MSWRLRRAVPADLAQIMAIEREVFATDAWSEAVMGSELAGPNAHYLVAAREDDPTWAELVAYAGLLAPPGAVIADVQTVAVRSTDRRGGLGRTLMLALEAEARRRGAREVLLEVRADNPDAQRLYVSLGYEPIATRRGYYQPDGVDALVMRHVLEAPRTVVVGS